MTVLCRFQWSLFAFVVSVVIIFARLCTCQNDDRFNECGKFFECGNLQTVGYPFYGKDRPEYCGYRGFELTCDDVVPHITIERIVYRVLSVENDEFMVAREDLWNSTCPTRFDNTSLDTSVFNYAQNYQNITIFYRCSFLGVPSVLPYQFDCSGASFYIASGVALSNLVTCDTSITVPVSVAAIGVLVNPTSNESTLRSALTSGFGLQWFADNTRCSQCTESRGRCGYDSSTNSFACHCSDGQYPLTCGDRNGRKSKYMIPTVIATGVFLVAVGTALVSFTAYKRANNRKDKNVGALIKPYGNLYKMPHNKNDVNVEDFMKQFGSAGPKQYSYSQIKKMTNSFADKLGEGGYGSVYKGKLQDGSLVAVKVLSGRKGNGEDFINEVASISRTSHVNVVTLLGFCIHKDRRALIFKFMPNGSLDKFVNRNRSDSDIYMDCKTLFKIAVGAARGLEYLHRGCNTRIVHFDIKPHNILLDEDFCPKISDFGLAKLSETKESMFSKLSARGTIGYIAPEMVFRNFGGVSSKSDVYSYGMMILEMVGVRTNPRTQVDRSSQLYFPNWIYEQLELGKDLEIQVLEDDDEEEMARKLILVGLWCIQTKPSDRPSMSKVVEMLEGSVQSLQLPPKPLLYGPEASPQESSGVSPQQSSTSLS